MRFIAAIDTRIYGISYAQGAEVDTSAWARRQMLQYLNLGLIQANQITAADITQALIIQGDGVSQGQDAQGRLVVTIEALPQSIDWLTDVDTTGKVDGSVLVWDEVDQLWKPAMLTDIPGGGGSMTLAGLEDVDVAGAIEGSVLVYDEISGTWVVGEPLSGSLAGLTDVDVTGILDGQTVIWDNSAGLFVPGSPMGEPGPPGPVTWATPVPWNSATNYTIGPPASVVTYLGSAYVAIAPSINQLPTNTTFWRLIVAKGEQGEQGDVGPASTVPGPPGPGVPTGGTAGQVLTKDSGTDYDTSWQDPATGTSTEDVQDIVGAMVEAAGGTYDDTAGTITLPSGSGGGGPGLFRGVWASLSVDSALDLWPVPGAVTITDVSGASPSGSATPSGTGAPSGDVLRLGNGAPSGGDFPNGVAYAEVTVPTGVVQMRLYAKVIANFWSNPGRILKNGVSIFNSLVGWGWLEFSVAAGDVIRIETYITGSGTAATWHLDAIEWLVPLDPPYSAGEYVLHLDRLWRSNVYNNAGTPGTSGWTEARLVVDAADIADSTTTGRSLVTAADAAAARTAAGVSIYDAETLMDHLANTGLVEGANVTLDYDDVAGTLAISSTATGGGGEGGAWRGEWSTLQLVTDFDMGSTGTVLPSPFSKVSGNAQVVANPGGVGAPVDGTVLYIQASAGAVYDVTELTIPTGITQIRYYTTVTYDEGGPATIAVTKNGGAVETLDNASAWTLKTINVVAGDVIRWTPTGGGYRIYSYHADFKFYGTADPYMIGDGVYYNGKIYTSAVDNNASTPGANADWLEHNLTVEAVDITNSSSIGRSVLTAVSQTEARDAIGAASAAGSWRGAWASVVVIETLDLSAGVPSIFTSSVGFSTVANPGGAGAPTGANVMTATANTGTRTANLTVPAGITKIRAKVRATSGFGMQGSANMQVGLLPFGGVFLSSTGGYAANTWYTLEVNVNPGDARGLYAYAQFSDNVVGWWGQIELMGSPDPYMTGDSVTYNGKIYTSTVNNNASTPGTNTDWVENPLRTIPAGGTFTFEGPMAAGTGTKKLYNDTGSPITITKVRLAAGTAPTSDMVLDVHKSGTTIFTTQANRPKLTSGQAASVSAAPDVTSWADGEYLTIDVDSAGAAADVVLTVVCH